MTMITDTDTLKSLCKALAAEPFITVDTEFLRDKTYYPQLCLVQLAAPQGEPVAVDPLSGDVDLKPLLDLMANPKVLKVFHAARQDMEIFYNLMDEIPAPLFDTQVAAMVCGYGESVGYHNLVSGICHAKLDKSAQFTDWSRRPLSKKQLVYALDDVTYLRDVYRHLAAALDKQDRTKWVEQEMAILNAPETYQNPLEDAWQRIRIRTDKPKILAVLREIAAWREKEAQRRDVPRSRVIRDEILADLAVHAPRTADDLSHIRGLPREFAHGRLGKEMLEAIHRGLETPPEKAPRAERRERFPSDLTPVLEMLKMLLRIQCAEHDVASKLVASQDDLEALALDDAADIPALKGWRYEVFGAEALALKQGKITLGLSRNKIVKAAPAPAPRKTGSGD